MLQENSIPDNVPVVSEMFKERELLRQQFMKSLFDMNKNSKRGDLFHAQNNRLCLRGISEEFISLKKQLITIKQFFQAKSISLFIFDEKKQILQFNTTTGISLNQNNSDMFLRVAEKALCENEPVVISDICKYASAHDPDEKESGSILATQLVYKKQLKGILLFYKKEKYGFDMKHVQFYKVYADEVARSVASHVQENH